MKKEVLKKAPKKITIDDLASMVAKGFSQVSDEMSSFRTEMSSFRTEMSSFRIELDKTKELIVDTNRNVLNLVDKFPSRSSFDQLTTRVYKLENTVYGKKTIVKK